MNRASHTAGPNAWFRTAREPAGGGLAALARNAQRSLDLAAAPLLRSLYVRGFEDGSARLLLVMHHLTVDGVSWRVLTSLHDALHARPVAVPPSGFVAWARRRRSRSTPPNGATGARPRRAQLPPQSAVP